MFSFSMVLDFWPFDVFYNSRSFHPRFLTRIMTTGVTVSVTGVSPQKAQIRSREKDTQKFRRDINPIERFFRLSLSEAVTAFRRGMANAKMPLKTKHTVNERRLRREEGGTDSQVFRHQDATAPAGFGPDGPAARVLQDDGGCVGRVEGDGAGVGGVVGDERGDALEDDPLVGTSGRCGPRRRRTRGLGRRRRGSARMSRVCVGTPRLRSSITAMESSITTATWRGERPQPSRRVSMSGNCVPRKPMMLT